MTAPSAISSSELRMALRKLGVNLDAREAAEMLDRHDADHRGQIELSAEFWRLAEDLPSLTMQGLQLFLLQGEQRRPQRRSMRHRYRWLERPDGRMTRALGRDINKCCVDWLCVVA